MFPDLRKRSLETELMDLPDVDEKKLLKTIREFSILNLLFSGSRKLIRKTILPLMKKESSGIFSVLDIGSGGCDIPIWLVKEARKYGIRLSVTALDYDARIQGFVREAVKNFPEIKPLQGSAFELEKYGRFDFVISNHFLHHIDDESIPELLGKIARCAEKAFLINDLRRSWWAYIGYTVFTGLFFRESLAFVDGRISIRKGFLREELEEHIKKANSGVKMDVISAFPFRLAVFGKRNS